LETFIDASISSLGRSVDGVVVSVVTLIVLFNVERVSE
jgi:hypothetical protein